MINQILIQSTLEMLPYGQLLGQIGLLVTGMVIGIHLRSIFPMLCEWVLLMGRCAAEAFVTAFRDLRDSWNDPTNPVQVWAAEMLEPKADPDPEPVAEPEPKADPLADPKADPDPEPEPKAESDINEVTFRIASYWDLKTVAVFYAAANLANTLAVRKGSPWRLVVYSRAMEEALAEEIKTAMKATP